MGKDDNFENLLNGLERINDYNFFINKDYRCIKDIWERNYNKVKKITYNIKQKMYSSGMDWDDYLQIATMSLYDSIYAYDLRLEIPLIAFIIVRLRSDIFKHVREQMKNGNKALNQAIMVDWQDEEFKQPKTNSPYEEYLNDQRIIEYIEIIKTTKLLKTNEREAILQRINQSKYTRKKINSKLTKHERQKMDNAYQRGKQKLLKSNI